MSLFVALFWLNSATFAQLAHSTLLMAFVPRLDALFDSEDFLKRKNALQYTDKSIFSHTPNIYMLSSLKLPKLLQSETFRRVFPS